MDELYEHVESLEHDGHFAAAVALIDDPAVGSFSAQVRSLMIDDLWDHARALHAHEVVEALRLEIDSSNESAVNWTMVVVGGALMGKRFATYDVGEEDRPWEQQQE